MKSIVYKIVGNLDIVVLGEGVPLDPEWSEYVAAILTEEKKGLDLSKLRTLVFSDGGGPNATQRQMVNDALKGRASRVAMVSSSMMVRGITTALAWFNPEMKMFPPERVTDAFRFLDIPASQFDRTWSDVQKLRVDLGNAKLKSIVAGGVLPGFR